MEDIRPEDGKEGVTTLLCVPRASSRIWTIQRFQCFL